MVQKHGRVGLCFDYRASPPAQLYKGFVQHATASCSPLVAHRALVSMVAPEVDVGFAFVNACSCHALVAYRASCLILKEVSVLLVLG